MSTKIYNGFIINKEVSIYKLNEMMNIIRKEINKTYEEIALKDFVKLASSILDNKYTMNNKEYNSYLKRNFDFEFDDMYEIFKEKINESTNRIL